MQFIVTYILVLTHHETPFTERRPPQYINGEDKMIRLSGVSLGEACTVVLKGATNQIIDEAERSLQDALCVLTQTVKETRTVFGGGREAYMLCWPYLSHTKYFIALPNCTKESYYDIVSS